MNKQSLKLALFFVLGVVITVVTYEIHRYSAFFGSSRDMHLALNDRVMWLCSPPGKKIEEAEVFASALEFAEHSAQERIRALFPPQYAALKLVLIPRSSGYEILLFAPELSSGQREAVSKIIGEEMAAGQRQSAKIALEAIQQASEPTQGTPNRVAGGN
jgi:hypothetical protein